VQVSEYKLLVGFSQTQKVRLKSFLQRRFSVRVM